MQDQVELVYYLRGLLGQMAAASTEHAEIPADHALLVRGLLAVCTRPLCRHSDDGTYVRRSDIVALMSSIHEKEREATSVITEAGGDIEVVSVEQHAAEMDLAATSCPLWYGPDRARCLAPPYPVSK